MSSFMAGVRSFAGECIDAVGEDFDANTDNRRVKCLRDCRVEKLLAVAGAVAALAFSVAVIVSGVGGFIGVAVGVALGSAAMLFCHDLYQYNTKKEQYFSPTRTNIVESISKCDPKEFTKNTILFGDLFAAKDRAAAKS